MPDDTKVYRIIKREDDRNVLQRDIDNLIQWSETWLMELNTEKCKCLAIKKKYSTATIGIIFDEGLNFDDHITEKINKANKVYGL